MRQSSKKVSATEFDHLFDEGDVVDQLDLSTIKAKHPVQRVSIDFPKSILASVDEAAAKIGVTRNALIKMWVAEHCVARS